MSLTTHTTDIGTIGIAHLAYKTYHKSLGYPGPIPPFDDLPDKEKEAWLTVANNVIDTIVYTLVKI